MTMRRFTAKLAMCLAAKRIDGALAAASVMQVRLNVGLFFEAVETFLIAGGEAPSMRLFPTMILGENPLETASDWLACPLRESVISP